MADVNFDSRVDIQDITLIANNWLKTGSLGQLPGDANRDGRVDIQDITLVANNWNPGGISEGERVWLPCSCPNQVACCS